MKKLLGMLAVVVSLLVPAQVVMADFHDHAMPFWEKMISVQMEMGEVMKQMMEKKKMMMTPEQEKKLMKMLNEIEELLKTLK